MRLRARARTRNMSQPTQPLTDAQPRTPPEAWPRPGQRQWPPQWAVGSDEDSVEDFTEPPASEVIDDDDGPQWPSGGGGVVVPATPSPPVPATPQTPAATGDASTTVPVPTPILSAAGYRAAVARLRELEHRLYVAGQAMTMMRAQRDDVLAQLASYEDMLYADNSSANDNDTQRPRRQRTRERRQQVVRSARARLFAAAIAGTVVL